MGKGGHRARMPHRLLLLCLVEQGHGVRDARDEPAQAGEQQQFFDLPDHDVHYQRIWTYGENAYPQARSDLPAMSGAPEPGKSRPPSAK